MKTQEIVNVLVVESTVFGYDGITNVIINYFRYQDHDKVHMDFVTINDISDAFLSEINKYKSKNFVLSYRNSNPIKYVVELIKILKRGEYQIIHVHGCSATMVVEMFAAKLAGVKIRISHSHNTKCDHVKLNKLLKPFFSRLCNVGFACGKEAGQWMFQDKEFSVITNGIDLDKFAFNSLARKEMRSLYELNGKIVIGHVGRFSKQKNHEKLVDIFSEFSKIHSNAKLVLIGDGELREEMQQRVKRENLDVLFVGISNEIEKWLQAIDIMVFPSLYEGLPLVLIEAQAAGLPCVLSDTISPDTAITDLIEFVELENTAKKWAIITDSLMNKYNRAERIEDVKKQIRNAHFDIRANCKELADIYEQLVECGGNR